VVAGVDVARRRRKRASRATRPVHSQCVGWCGGWGHQHRCELALSSSSASSPTSNNALFLLPPLVSLTTHSHAPLHPTHSTTASASMMSSVSAVDVKGVGKSLVSEYKKTATTQTKIVDLFLAFILVTGALQFVYCVIVGSFPFNSFLSGFLSCVGMFALTGTFFGWWSWGGLEGKEGERGRGSRRKGVGWGMWSDACPHSPFTLSLFG